MRRVRVDVIMNGSLLPLPEVRRVTRALQKQVKRDFAPIWNVVAEVRFVGTRHNARPGAWQLVLLDEADREVDGYHELTREGLPLGRVYLRSAMSGGSAWSLTASHELLELLANPEATLGVLVWSKSGGGRIYSQEVCDPCQDDRFGYRIDGVVVSDFVHPAWFEPWRKPRSTRFDHAKKLTRPFEVPEACYATYYDARRRKWVDADGGQHTPHLEPMYGYGRARTRTRARTLGDASSTRSRKKPPSRGGSRKLLRQVPRPQWRKSDF
jgi:hypothetical protein